MLTEHQVRDHVRKSSKRSYLSEMVRHQNWVKMHADTAIDNSKCTEPYARFMGMVHGILPDDKYEMFASLLRFPLPSTAVTSVVFDRLSRVFEGRNPAINYQFENTKFNDDWEYYRQEKLDEPNVWKTKAWNYFKTEPNSILVVDMPEVHNMAEDKYVQPYFYWVKIEDVIDYDTDTEGRIIWLIFKNDDLKKVYEFDDEYYRVFEYADPRGVDYTNLGQSYSEKHHGLGYCPAMFFVDQPVSLDSPDVKASPITNALSELDWYNFAAASKKHLDLYGSYPIYYGYEPDCDYEQHLPNGGVHKCSHGILVDEMGNMVMNEQGKAMRCPKCAGHRTAGAGSYIEVPVPAEGEIDFGDHPVGMLKVDRDSLDFNSDELARKKKEIIAICVGVDADTSLSEFSVSDKQVDANYESQSTILVRVKKTFENAQKFVDDTICRLRYGKMFISSSINYGTEFYTLTTSDLRKRYQAAETGGAPESDLANLRKQIIETEYRTNPLLMQRMIILTDVEPLLGFTKNAAIDACNKGYVDEIDCKVKINFESLIKRFERENGNIINYAVDMEYVNKIENIKQILENYVKGIRVKSVDTAAVQQTAEE